jgi:hypothetical protein
MVFHYHGLSPFLPKFLSDNSRGEIDRTASRKGDDDPYCLGRELLSRAARRQNAKRRA